jgi:vanillate/3-O-methylgallate O-demethylase
MAGAPGLEVFGPYEEENVIRAALLEAGTEFGLKPIGFLAYPTTTLESGWIPLPMPAIFTGEGMKAYREWLPAEGLEGTCSLGGSFYSDDIRDYYFTPHELGYGPFVKFDHEFIGRKTLEARGETSKRRKVTLHWNGEDVAHAMGTLFQRGPAAKFIALPWSAYSRWQYDKVVQDGRTVGISSHCGYTYNERAMLSLGVVDDDVPIGAEVKLIWGEEGGGSPRPVVERHRQVEIRAIVSPCPYSEVTRSTYAPGWRTKAAEA